MSAVLEPCEMPMPPGPIKGPAAWYGSELSKETNWLRPFSDAELTELDSAMRSIQAKGLEVININRANFPLPRLEPVLDEVRRELLEGRGFVLCGIQSISTRPGSGNGVLQPRHASPTLSRRTRRDMCSGM